MEATKKRKTITAVAAVVAAAAIALTGTFAWQSISQEATNVAAGIANPGGRLHDDFSYTSDVRNKDIYVENFTSTTDGQAIFARIRLDEYMELGTDAGENREASDRKAIPLVEGADINDVTTWKTHIPDAADDSFHEYWTWTTGGQTVYMPTFNMNKDSLTADVNGTYAGTDPADDVHYDDYHAYTAGEIKTGDEIYDADEDTEDEPNPVEGTDITTVAAQTHTAKDTVNGTVMTMAQWKAAGSKPGDYWVYDTDGWAYWANPIEPGTATGLLLDDIELSKKPGQSWYYAINVVAQFVTVDDWGADDNTGFFDSSEGSAPTGDALALLGAISGKTSGLTISADDSMTEIFAGDTRAFSAQAIMLGEVLSDTVIWDLSGATSPDTTINDTGLLTVGMNETIGNTLTVTATNTRGQTASTTLTVKDVATEVKAITPGSTDTVTIDGREWYVLVNDNDNNRALLWAKEMEATFGTNGCGVFDGTVMVENSGDNVWETSSVRTWLNGTYLTDDLSTLQNYVVETAITTRSEFDGENWITTTDKVFLLSEADLFGTFSGRETSEEQDYTYGTSQLVTNVNMRKCDNTIDNYHWLRSPATSSVRVGACTTSSGLFATGYSWYDNGIRPAMWITLTGE
jgi:hypothetical protein